MRAAAAYHHAAAEERLEVLGQIHTAGVARVHRDEGAGRSDKGDLLLLEDDRIRLGLDAVEYAAELASYDREHLDGDAVELVEASPRAHLREALENVAGNLVVHLVGAIHHLLQYARPSRKSVLGSSGKKGPGFDRQ